MKTTRCGALAALALLSLGGAVRAEEAPATLGEALKESRVIVELNLRHEQVSDDAVAGDEAQATTLRTVVGFETKPYHGWLFRVEAEDVSAFDGDSYANGGFGGANNGVTGRPVIADPDGTAMHRAYVRWQHGKLALQVGRDEILLGSQRFVGNVGWRQHHQTFDAASLRYQLASRWQLFYAFIESVQRINRATDDLDGHLAWVEGDLGTAGRLTLHGEWLDYATSARRPLSSATLGAQWSGAWVLGGGKLLTDLGYAHQGDAGDNPRRIDADYALGGLGFTRGGWTLRGGWERLDGSARDGQFNTPLATLHKFNGWADKFLTTPANGLVDRYAQLEGKHGATSWVAAYHDFVAATGSAAYGTEIDLQLVHKLRCGVALGAKAALYDADRFAADTEKWWLWASYSL